MRREFFKSMGLGFGGGTIGGAICGVSEGIWISVHAGSGGNEILSVIAYSMALYAILGGIAGLGFGFLFHLAGRILERECNDGEFYGAVLGLVLGCMGFIAWRFLIRRDVFHEQLTWWSSEGIALQGGMFIGFSAIFILFWKGAGRIFNLFSRRIFLNFWAGPLIVFIFVVVMGVGGKIKGERSFRGDESISSGMGSKTEKVVNKLPSGPNVVLIMVDTLRADYTDPYGAEGLTPNLLSFAKEGIVFERAYAQASWTRPSVATVLSGRFPSSHKAIYKMDTLPGEVETLSEVLKDAGYRTYAFVTNYVISPYFGFAQGFEEYHYLEPAYFFGAWDSTSKLIFYEGLKALWSRVVARGSRPGAQYQDADVLTKRVIEWFEKRKEKGGAGEKFFLFVQYMDPHDPYFAHPYDGTSIARKANADPPHSWLPKMKNLYRGEVKYFDEYFGKLLNFMKSESWWKDSLVIFFADHGEEFLEHGGWWHGDTLYEEQVRVPLIVKLPGGRDGGKIVKGLSGLIDIAPTICRIAGAGVLKTFQGLDLFEERTDPLFLEEDHVGNSVRSIVYRRGDKFYKIIRANEGNPRKLPLKSLFELTSDPHEKKDISEIEAKEYAKGAELLQKNEKLASSGAVLRKSIELDETSKERLKELGYIR